MSNVINTDILNAFTCNTPCEALVYVLGREAPRMTRELLVTTAQYAMGEDAILANFDNKGKATAPA